MLAAVTAAVGAGGMRMASAAERIAARVIVMPRGKVQAMEYGRQGHKESGREGERPADHESKSPHIHPSHLQNLLPAIVTPAASPAIGRFESIVRVLV
jgi:hypothetical protein